MRQYLAKNPLVKFIALALVIYLVWNLFYESVLAYTGLDHALSMLLGYSSKFFLSIFGYSPLLQEVDEFVVLSLTDMYGGVDIGTRCNGLNLFSLFAIYVIAFPGPWRKKLWFIPLGIVLIHLLNIIRIAILVIIAEKAPESLDFNHNYTFQIVVYGFVFFLWYFWTSRLSGVSLNKNNTAS